MLQGIAILLGLQLLGEIIVNALDWPIPGPVLGMVFLFTFLMIFKKIPKQLKFVSEGILKHLSLLYVPAGVGVVQYLSEFKSGGVSIFSAIVVSTIVALVTTGWALQLLLRNCALEDDDHDEQDGAV